MGDVDEDRCRGWGWGLGACVALERVLKWSGLQMLPLIEELCPVCMAHSPQSRSEAGGQGGEESSEGVTTSNGRWGASLMLTEFPKADVAPDPVNSPRTPSLPIAAMSFPLHRGSLAEKSYSCGLLYPGVCTFSRLVSCVIDTGGSR